MRGRRRSAARHAAIAGAGLVALLGSAGWASAPPREAVKSPLAAESLLLDVARAGERLVAVGEWGHVVLSDDAGRSWRQAESVPTQATLTEVFFVDERRGWAVGHDAIVLHTRDGGDTWTLQYAAPEEEAPLLSVWFEDSQRGLAAGAFSLMLETRDGGQTWEPRSWHEDSGAAPAGAPEPGAEPGLSVSASSAPDEPDAEQEVDEVDYHLNHIFPGPEGSLFIAGEAGTVLRSRDRGRSWEHLQLPYEGSFWGGLCPDGRSVLVFGMRGHVFRSHDLGDSWQPVESGTDQSLQGATRLRDGTLVVVGLGGTVLRSADGGRTFSAAIEPDRRGIAAATEGVDGQLLLFGEAGIKTRRLPEARTRSAGVPSPVAEPSSQLD